MLACNGEHSGVPGSTTACTGPQDPASSRQPDVLCPDCSGYNSPASLFPLPARPQLKNTTAALPCAAPASWGTGSGHAPFLPIRRCCQHQHPLGELPGSWRRAGTSPGFCTRTAQLPWLLQHLRPPAYQCFCFHHPAEDEGPKNHKDLRAGMGQAPAAVSGSHQGAVIISPTICLSFPIRTAPGRQPEGATSFVTSQWVLLQVL